MNRKDIQIISETMKFTLGLSSLPLGVSLFSDRELNSAIMKPEKKLRFCQAIMKAREGEIISLDKNNLSCPAASAAFGFRQLPLGYKTGKALVGQGLVTDEAIGRTIMKGMSRLEKGKASLLHLYPLNKSPHNPDIIIVEDEVEKLMWIALAYIHERGGTKILGSTFALQATCVDSTIVPYIENRLNYSYGCHGCRGATNMGHHEAIIGFPGHMLASIVKHLEFLHKKAIPDSRSKKIFKVLK